MRGKNTPYILHLRESLILLADAGLRHSELSIEIVRELKLKVFIRNVLLCGKFQFWSERQKARKLKCFAWQMKSSV